MPLGLTKFLFSITLVGSAIAGSSYGVVQLFKNGNSEKISVPKVELEEKKDLIFSTSSPEDENPSRDLEESKNHVVNSSPEEKLKREKEHNNLTSTPEKEEASVDSTKEDSNSQDNKNPLENKDDFVESSVSENIKTQENEFNKQLQVEEFSEEDLKRQEREKQSQYKQEAKSKEISLEVTWISNEDRFPKKTCFLSTDKNLKEEEIPDLVESSEGDDDCDDYRGDNLTTKWASDKVLGYENQERLWVRGQNDKIKGFFRVNWDNLQGFDFIAKEKKKEELSSFELQTLLTNICKIAERTNEDPENWMEIECINTKARIQEKINKRREEAISSSRKSSFARPQVKNRKRR